MKRSLLLLPNLFLGLLLLGGCENSPTENKTPPPKGKIGALSPGEAATFDSKELAHLRFSAGGEYALIPFNSLSSGSTRIRFDGLSLSTAASMSSALAPSLRATEPRFASSSPTAHDEFERALRNREIRQLTPRVAAAQDTWRDLRHESFSQRPSFALGAAPSVGQFVTYNTDATYGCSNPDYRTGRVMAVGSRVVVVADTANPKDGLTGAEYANVASQFDDFVWPTLTETFGTPTDIDNNGKVVIFYTRAVNEMTERGSNGYIGGFFYSRDLFPKTTTQGFEACPSSNEAEMFYMLAADPLGKVNGNARSRDLVLRTTLSTVGHEFQHLINSSRRLYINQISGTAWNEVVWLNEGLSHIAEELLFYRASGLNAGQNINLQTLTSSQPRVDAANNYLMQNLGRLGMYLERPASESPFQDDDDLETRGAIWSFLRYAADRHQGDEQQLWYDLVNANTNGRENLSARLGASLDEWAHDWGTANFTDDFIITSEIYTHPSWNFRSIYPALYESGYPLASQLLTNGTRTVSVGGGSSTYLRVAPLSGGELMLSDEGQELPSTISARIIRLR